jgi:hypothetical protein
LKNKLTTIIAVFMLTQGFPIEPVMADDNRLDLWSALQDDAQLNSQETSVPDPLFCDADIEEREISDPTPLTSHSKFNLAKLGNTRIPCSADSSLSCIGLYATHFLADLANIFLTWATSMSLCGHSPPLLG